MPHLTQRDMGNCTGEVSPSKNKKIKKELIKQMKMETPLSEASCLGTFYSMLWY